MGTPSRLVIGGWCGGKPDVGHAQGLPFADEHAQQAMAARQRAEGRAFFGAQPGGDEFGQVAVRARNAERAVAGTSDAGRDLHDPPQHLLGGQPGGERPGGLVERLQPDAERPLALSDLAVGDRQAGEGGEGMQHLGFGTGTGAPGTEERQHPRHAPPTRHGQDPGNLRPGIRTGRGRPHPATCREILDQQVVGGDGPSRQSLHGPQAIPLQPTVVAPGGHVRHRGHEVVALGVVEQHQRAIRPAKRAANIHDLAQHRLRVPAAEEVHRYPPERACPRINRRRGRAVPFVLGT